MGNRGIIHDPATRRLLRRRWTSKAWIICLCAFKGVRRQVMGGRSWTELFFLDEATALAAGHRPCFFCRREAAEAFRAAWAKGNGGAKPRASEMDETLHRERLDGGQKRLHSLSAPVAALPDGAMLAVGNAAYLIAGGKALPWSPSGYGDEVVAGGGRPAFDPALHGPRLGRGLFRDSRGRRAAAPADRASASAAGKPRRKIKCHAIRHLALGEERSSRMRVGTVLAGPAVMPAHRGFAGHASKIGKAGAIGYRRQDRLARGARSRGAGIRSAARRARDPCPPGGMPAQLEGIAAGAARPASIRPSVRLACHPLGIDADDRPERHCPARSSPWRMRTTIAVRFARQKRRYVTRLAVWSVDRDNAQLRGASYASSTCSSVNQSAYQFSKIFQGFYGRAVYRWPPRTPSPTVPPPRGRSAPRPPGAGANCPGIARRPPDR